jgi:site-specific recombinase XerC
MTPRKHLTTEETSRLFRAITSIRDRAIFRLMYHRGLRASEVGALQMEDYRADVGKIFVYRLKGRKKNTDGEYLLTSKELRDLRAWVKIRGNDPGPIFTSNRGTAISRKMLDVLMKRYAAAAGIPDHLRHCHSLRHSCAVHLLDNDGDIARVQDHLGHRNITSTQEYAKVSSKRRDDFAKIVGRL